LWNGKKNSKRPPKYLHKEIRSEGERDKGKEVGKKKQGPKVNSLEARVKINKMTNPGEVTGAKGQNRQLTSQKRIGVANVGKKEQALKERTCTTGSIWASKKNSRAAP